jgi:hypothetical protein
VQAHLLGWIASYVFEGIWMSEVKAVVLRQALREAGDDLDAQFAMHAVRAQHPPDH